MQANTQIIDNKPHLKPMKSHDNNLKCIVGANVSRLLLMKYKSVQKGCKVTGLNLGLITALRFNNFNARLNYSTLIYMANCLNCFVAELLQPLTDEQVKAIVKRSDRYLYDIGLLSDE